MFKRALTFTGHMIDLPERATPRFPTNLEQAAKQAIFECIKSEQQNTDNSLVGVSSCARGADILFIETLQELGIEHHVILPFSAEEFLKTSVKGVPSGNWENRFNKIWNNLNKNHKEIITTPKNEDPYDACNDRILEVALSLASETKLLALWDGAQPDAPGGTAAFVKSVKDSGGKFHHISTRDLLALETPE